jgi:hypothetical protein
MAKADNRLVDVERRIAKARGKPRKLRISPSSYKTFRSCRRKWYYQKVLGVPEGAGKKHLVLGSAVHLLLELYLRDGVSPDQWNADHLREELWAEAYTPGQAERQQQTFDELVEQVIRIARSGVDLLRPARKAIKEGKGAVELRLAGQCGPLPYLSFSDVLFSEDPGGRGIPAVYDHKTSSNPQGRYAHQTEEQVRRDPQLLFYAHAATDAEDRVDGVVLRHTYFPTKGGNARYIEGVATEEEINANWQKFEHVAQLMLDTQAIERPEEVAGTKSTCKAYGGCPFADVCPKTTNMENDPMPLDLSKLKSKTTKTPPPVAKTPPPMPKVPAKDHFAVAMETAKEQWSRGGAEAVSDEALTFLTAYIPERHAEFVKAFRAWQAEQSPRSGLVPRGAKVFQPSSDFSAAKQAAQGQAKAKAIEALATPDTKAGRPAGDKPYVRFINSCPDRIDITSDEFKKLVGEAHEAKRVSKKMRQHIVDEAMRQGDARMEGNVMVLNTGEGTEPEVAVEAPKPEAPLEVEVVKVETPKPEVVKAQAESPSLLGAAPAPTLRAKLVQRPVVLVGCFGEGAVDVDVWLRDIGAHERFEALTKVDTDLVMPYFCSRFGRGAPAMAAVLADMEAPQPPVRYIPKGHPLEGLLPGMLASKGAWVIRG